MMELFGWLARVNCLHLGIFKNFVAAVVAFVMLIKG